MKTPYWESSAGALAALLNNTTQLYMVDLYTFTLSGGSSVLKWSGGDRSITVHGDTFTLDPLLTRGRTQTRVGIQTDSLDLTIAPGPNGTTVNGVSLLAFLTAGGLDGARLRLERAFAASAGDAIVGTLILFAGRVSDLSIAEDASVEVVSDSEVLDVMVPRNLYQPGCVNTLYDGACGEDRAANTFSAAVVTSATNARGVIQSDMPSGTYIDYEFDLGTLVFTSGPNTGIGRTIKSFVMVGGYAVVTFIAPFPFLPVSGNTFTITRGCDKLFSTCSGRFGNQARYRGLPFIPVPEIVT